MSVTTYDYAGYLYDAPVSYDDPLQQVAIGARISAQGGCRGNTIYNAVGISYNQSLYIYNPTVCPNGSISIQAKISNRAAASLLIRCDVKAQNARAFTCQADIRNTTHRTFTCQAHILAAGQHAGFQTLLCQARIMPYKLLVQADISNRSLRQLAIKVWFSRQQGFPIIDPSNPAFPLFQPTQLILKANIVNNIRRSTQALLTNVNISPHRATTLTARTHIGRSGRLSIQANIVPKVFTTTVLGIFNVEGNFTTTVLGTFNVAGLFSKPNLGIGTRIVRLNTRRVVGHFTIPAAPTTSALDSSISAGGSASSKAITGIGAFIS